MQYRRPIACSGDSPSGSLFAWIAVWQRVVGDAHPAGIRRGRRLGEECDRVVSVGFDEGEVCIVRNLDNELL